MRLWTLHPRYLDRQGLIALWREALLAQAVLLGQTRGYTHHPQVQRFRQSKSPVAAIAAYLDGVLAEAVLRGYDFDRSKIIGTSHPQERIVATSGQLAYEWEHLKKKLAVRAPSVLAVLPAVALPDSHPLFTVEEGAMAAWEVVAPSAQRNASPTTG